MTAMTNYLQMLILPMISIGLETEGKSSVECDL